MNSLLLQIVLNDYYKDVESISKLLNYADKLNLGLTTGINCSSDTETACKEFFAVNDFYQKTPSRLIRHFFITSDTIKDELKMLRIAYNIGLYYLNDYQVFIGVHNDTKHLHAHFIMNTVSLRTGLIYSASPHGTASFVSYIKSLGFDISIIGTAF